MLKTHVNEDLQIL